MTQLGQIKIFVYLIDRLRAMGSAALNMCSVGITFSKQFSLKFSANTSLCILLFKASGGADCYFEFGIHAWDIGIPFSKHFSLKFCVT